MNNLLSGYGSDGSDGSESGKKSHSGLVGYGLGYNSDSSEASDAKIEQVNHENKTAIESVQQDSLGVVDSEEMIKEKLKLELVQSRRIKINALLPKSNGEVNAEIQYKIEVDTENKKYVCICKIYFCFGCNS